jgi:hypothetical protein
MWDWVNCHLLNRHQYAVCCEHGAILLRCLMCGHRSTGWQVEHQDLILQSAHPLRWLSFLHTGSRRTRHHSPGSAS